MAALGLWAARPAFAQGPTQAPSAKELWQDYPLDQGEGDAPRTAPPSPTPAAAQVRLSSADDRTGAAGSDDSHAARTIAAMLIAAAAAAAAAALLLMRRRGGRRKPAGKSPSPSPAVSQPRPAAPRVSGDSMPFTPASLIPQPTPKELAQTGRDAALQGDGVPPPETGRAWTAEIQWRHSDEDSRFCVIAQDAVTGKQLAIAHSDPLEWPPADSNGVQALVDASDALTEALRSAGWKQREPGSAWYEQHFEWEPVGDWVPPRPLEPAAPEAAAPPAGTTDPPRGFRIRPWPQGTEALWRCEIKWRPSYARSRFEAVAHGPDHGGDRVVGTSRSFKRMLHADAERTSAAFRDQVRNLAAALEAAGWERLGTGAQWYSQRFVWRGEDEPPGRVDPTSVKADRAS